MESVRAYLIVSGLQGICPNLTYYPQALDSDPSASQLIRAGGLYVRFPAASEPALREALAREPYIDSITAADDLPSATAAAVPVPEAVLPAGGQENAVAGNYISVHPDKLEELQNLTNELILAQSRLLHTLDIRSEEAGKLMRTAEALRSAVTGLRMEPLSGLFQRLHRAVREAGRKLERDMEFVATGTEVEVDKNSLDALSEALMQIVRNAAVHGIESPAERLALDKPLMGRITVAAKNTGTSILISVSDDGRGIDAEKVAQAAAQNGVTPAVPRTAEELLDLLAQAGVTTSSHADEMSGRGVGLDVVRTAVHKLRGSIRLETAVGSGTTFHIRIPQSLAVMDCICLGVGESLFLLPSLDIYAIQPPHPDDLIRYPDGRLLLRFQEHSLPLIDLGAYYGLRPAVEPTTGILAILEGETNAVAVYADELLPSERAAIKPLPALLETLGLRARGIAGCTILNDSRIGLVLDAGTLLTLDDGVE